MRSIFATIVLAASSITAAEPPLSADARTAMIAEFENTEKSASEAIAKSQENAELYSRRGDARLFLGRAKDAVADFEKMIAMDPRLDAPHWRLGIAYYFAGDFAKSAKQFEKYHAYDDRDRENGVWKFFAQARVDGVEKARAQMLAYTRFDREPFPAVYEMLAGKRTPAAVLEEMKTKGLTEDALVMFFAHYYIGWHEQLHGNRDAATEHFAKAVTLAQKAGASGGPGYMGQVARLHYEQHVKQ